MIFFNPSFDPNYKIETPTRSPLEFHKRLPLYSATPLHSLDSLAQQFGVAKLFVKDESRRLGLPAFKILGASWATYRTLGERYPDLIKDWSGVDDLAKKLKSSHSLALYSATDGNHGRAVARVAKMFGLRSRIYVPKGTAEARISAIQSEVASVTVVDGTYDDTVAMAAHDAEEARGLLIQDNGWKGYETIPSYVVEGYSTMLWEIDEALAEMNQEQPTHVVVQIGVGSFAEAIVRHYCAMNSSTTIIGVEPDSAACVLESVKAGKIVKVPGPHTSIMAGMNCDSPSLVSFPVMQKGIGCFISISDNRAKEAMRLLAQHKIVSGETGAAGMGALIEMDDEENRTSKEKIRLGERSRVLIISTEGATDPTAYENIIAHRI